MGMLSVGPSLVEPIPAFPPDADVVVLIGIVLTVPH
jgi:hypothetical protein